MQQQETVMGRSNGCYSFFFPFSEVFVFFSKVALQELPPFEG